VNKKKQKNFIHWHPPFPTGTRASEQKFFGSFFSKKNACLVFAHIPV
jgi:hypothetical protein